MDLSKMTLEQLATALLMAGQKTAVGGTPTATMGHGPGGLFSGMGLSRPLFSAMIMPSLGLQSILPTRPSNEMNPLFGIVTGVTASSGSEPTGVCDDPPVVGLTKLCTHSFLFGRYSRMTKVYDTDTFGRVINRGEFTDLQMMNLPTLDVGPMVPTIPGSSPSDLAKREVAKAMFEFAVAWGRDFARQVFVGSPANNTAGGGYKEFYGLDTLINTGYQDAETGQLCPAADSIVESFAHQQVNVHGSDLVLYVTAIYRKLKHIATKSGLMPVKWAIVMADQLFYAITEVWPCSYASYRCQVKETAMIDAVPALSVEASNKMRDEMRAGSYLLIDGVQVPVILDDGVAETLGANGVWESEIYFVPLTVIGGTPVTFMEYFNYDTPGGAMEAARLFAPDGTFYSTDGGRFFWVKKPPNNFCVQLLAKTEPRLMLLTPFIAARLTDVCYTILLPLRDWDPAGPSYHVDGGKTHDPFGGPSYYPPVRSNPQ